MLKSNAGHPRGILNLKAGEEKFKLSRYLPGAELSYFVEHHWIVEWDLRHKESYVAETLPHPCIPIVFEKDRSRIVGVVTGKFSRVLEGQGRVFGIKFRPGAFYPFAKSPVSDFTDRTLDIGQVFGEAGKKIEREILAPQKHREMIEVAENFLRERLPERDETIGLINQIVEHIIADREITRVEQLLSRSKLSKRTLQRIFHQYVGVSPKWVIKRYRLHEATEKLAEGGEVNWPQLALELGYFDQAHFIKDFKAMVGQSPTEYARGIAVAL